MPIKLFNLDLHISVIKDFENIVNTLYGKHQIEITNWSISGHNWVFNQPTANVKFINQYTCDYINDEMITKFNIEYGDLLSSYDGFIVTHTPVFALIYEQYNKPIIIINSCRFDQPFCWNNNANGLKWLIKGLYRLKEKGLLHIISNNKADQEYLLRGSGLESIYIPSLCEYTEAPYNPIYNQAILYNPSPYINTSTDIDKSQVAPKLGFGYSWKELHSYKVIIHLPYEISTMSIFEQYTAGVPMLFPTKEFYKKCHNDGLIINKSAYGSLIKTDIDFWLDRADFYNNGIYKNILYFNSFEEIQNIIKNFIPPSHRDIEYQRWTHKKNILEKWNSILYDIFFLQNNKTISWKFTTDYIQSDKLYHKFSSDPRIRYIKTDALIHPNISWYSQQHFETDKRLVMITSHSDLGVCKNLYEKNNFRSWYWITNNKYHINKGNNINNQRLFGLPLGLTNFIHGSPLHELYSNTQQIEDIRNEVGAKDDSSIEKQILCYMNFSTTTNPNIRESIWNTFYDKKFIVHDFPENTQNARLNYLRKMAQSKFVICPPGNGEDTHRLWEALYVGCIPIVLDNPVHDEWQDLPILFIKSWEDVTEDFLNKMWIEMAWRHYNFDKLTNTYWINFINNLCEKAQQFGENEQNFWIKCSDILSGCVNPKKILMNLKHDKELTFNITEYKRNDSKVVFIIGKFLAYFEEWNPNTNLIEDM
jgi:hypothetical protein